MEPFAISVWMCVLMGECDKSCEAIWVVSRLEKCYRNVSPFTNYYGRSTSQIIKAKKNKTKKKTDWLGLHKNKTPCKPKGYFNYCSDFTLKGPFSVYMHWRRQFPHHTWVLNIWPRVNLKLRYQKKSSLHTPFNEARIFSFSALNGQTPSSDKFCTKILTWDARTFQG